MFYDEDKKKLKPKYSLVMPCKAMCKTMRIIADTDGNAIYNGSLSDTFAKDLQDLGTIITKEDLVKYR
jgi:gamma-glutamyltranspeptidase